MGVCLAVMQGGRNGRVQHVVPAGSDACRNVGGAKKHVTAAKYASGGHGKNTRETVTGRDLLVTRRGVVPAQSMRPILSNGGLDSPYSIEPDHEDTTLTID